MFDEKPIMKELQQFPVIFTFKIIGEANAEIGAALREIFKHKSDASFIEKESGKGKYVSISITTEIKTYEELEDYYTEISKIAGVKFYV